MNSATAEKATAEKASLPTSGKLRRIAVAVTAACVLATSHVGLGEVGLLFGGGI